MGLDHDNDLYEPGDPRADRNRLSLARGAGHRPLWSRRLLGLGWGQRRSMAVMLLLGLAVTATYVAQGFLVAAALARVLVDATLEGVPVLVISAASLVVVRGGLLFTRDAVGAAMGERVRSDLRTRLYRKLVRLGPAWLEQTRTGTVQTVLTEAVDALELYFREFVTQAGVAAIGATALAAYLWVLDPVVGAVVAVAALAGALGPLLAWRVLGPLQAFWWREVPALRSEFLDSMQGMSTLKALGAVEARRRDLAAQTGRVRDAWMAITRTELWTHAPAWVLTTAGTLLAGAVAALRLSQGAIDGLGLLLALILAREVFRPVADFQLALHLTYKGISGGELVLDLLDAEPSVPEAGGTKPHLADPTVRFDSVTFTYPGSTRPAIDDLTVEIHPGEHVAIVGRSGAGKTTLVGLLLRFMDPSSGRISMTGHDVRELDPDHLRSHLAVVAQDTYLFHGTVLDNLLLARPDATRSDVTDACVAANADAFIRCLPEGYDTTIAERGTSLSGGQRQRLAIARALLKNAPILVLDEATSSVDVAGEAVIHDALDQLTAGRTTLVIAHRLSTIRDADRILVLEGGRLAEQGRHEDLREASGAYQRLVHAQEQS